MPRLHIPNIFNKNPVFQKMKLFVFGSTGDLVKRKVMKALQDLNLENLEIFAIGRKPLVKEEYRNFICSDWCSINFRKNIHYLQVDFNSLEHKNFEEHLDKSEINFFYISLPPAMQKSIFKFLASLLENYKIKVLVEKPFGESEASAIELQKSLESSGLKEHLIISDHYLFKKGFSNLDESKISNSKKIKIVSHEQLGLENRHGYYDSVGALKDMVQSHFLNLILKNLKIKINPEKIKLNRLVKGQYEDYEKELGKQSKTETIVMVEFESEGKIFHLSTGKAMKAKETFIEIDEEKIPAGDENSYTEIFKKFLALNHKTFPTVEDSILGWRILERLNKDSEIAKYKKGSGIDEILK